MQKSKIKSQNDKLKCKINNFEFFLCPPRGRALRSHFAFGVLIFDFKIVRVEAPPLSRSGVKTRPAFAGRPAYAGRTHFVYHSYCSAGGGTRPANKLRLCGVARSHARKTYKIYHCAGGGT